MLTEDEIAINKRKEFVIKHKNVFIAIGSALFVILVAIIIGRMIYLKVNNASLKILVGPSDAKILVNGKRYKNGEHHIKPGDYEIRATHDGFEDYSESFTVEEGGRKEIYVCMNNTDGVDWYQKDKTYGDICQEVYDRKFDDITKEVYKDKIFSVTPFSSYDKGFEIDAQLNEENGEITVTITPLSCRPDRQKGLEANALEWLQKAGLNLDDYTIVYNEGC